MYFDSYNYISDNYNCLQYQHHIKLLRRGIFLDTAPLFILVVGHYDTNHNTSFIKNFQSKDKKSDLRYRAYDYKYLLAFLNSCGLGKSYNLYITPQIFTEFIKHLWTSIEDPKVFNDIISSYFKPKWYIKEENVPCIKLIEEKDFLDKKLEIGDISITFLCKNKDIQKITLLTDDEKFRKIADEKYDFLTVYYNDIRVATMNLGFNKIPQVFLNEPTKIN